MFIAAQPYDFKFEPASTALLLIDFQRDFVEPGGFGESLGNDVSLLQAALGPARAVLEAARRAGLLVIHTREGHRPDLSDLHPAKQNLKRLRSYSRKELSVNGLQAGSERASAEPPHSQRETHPAQGSFSLISRISSRL